MSGDWSLETEAENKVIVKGEGGITPESLQGVLEQLHGRGVPRDAGLTINSGHTRWAVIAKWTPDAPEDTRPKLQQTVNLQQGSIIIEGPDAVAVARNIQRDSTQYRKLKDNPQA